MEESFWYERWERKNIGFHQSAPNPLLVENIGSLGLAEGSFVFLPLCGKTLDIGWLLGQGYRVVGAELSRKAVVELFEELQVEPTIEKLGEIEHFWASGLDIYVGNIFQVTANILGTIDAIYDRAALVALPPEMRKEYTKHLMSISNRAPQLLVTFTYEQELMPGPPFSVPREEVKAHYDTMYQCKELFCHHITLKGQVPTKESVWHLYPVVSTTG